MKSKLNTTSIGDDFESRSLEIIKKVIEEEQLGHLSKHLKIYTKKDKGYYSTLRKKEIYFDLTIEVWPPGATRYVSIYIIECKNYDKRIPVDDIEEFYSKIQQVSGVNVKGIFITNAPLQEAGFNIAESVGMMVIQGESAENYKIILHKTNYKLTQKKIPFIKETINDQLIDTGIDLIEKLLDKKLIEIFTENIDSSHVSYRIDRLSKPDIENIAENKIKDIDPKILSNGYSMSVKKLKEFIQNIESVDVFDLQENKDLLGCCDVHNKRIGVHLSIKNTERELFTLAHEYGHFVLHQKLTIGQKLYNNFSDPEYNFKTGKHDLKNPRNWIEWQANYFASSLILPKIPFLTRVLWYQERMGINPGKIYLDDQYHNIKDFNELIKRLAYFFNVSKTTIIYRANEMGLVNNQSHLKSIGQIIAEYKDDWFM